MTDEAAHPEGPSQEPSGAILVDATLSNPFHLFSLLSLYPLTIEINGRRSPGKWAKNTSPVSPGRYLVRVSFRSLYCEMAHASAEVTVYPGHATVLKYDAGIFAGIHPNLVLKGQVPLSTEG